MAARGAQSKTALKARFHAVLRALSRNPSPLTIKDLAKLLEEDGYHIDPKTPKKWATRGIPEKWARRIEHMTRAQEVGLTAQWMLERTGKPPLRSTLPIEASVLANVDPILRAEVLKELADELPTIIRAHTEVPPHYVVGTLESAAIWLYAHGFTRAAKDTSALSRRLRHRLENAAHGP